MKLLKYKRGQIWWYKMANSFDGSIQGKTRPVIIISNDLANANSKCLIGIPCTTSIKRYMPTHVDIDINGTPSTVLAENMMSLNVDRLTEYIGVLDDELLQKVERCMKIAVGLEPVTTIKKVVIHHTGLIADDCKPKEVDTNEGVYKLTDKGKELVKYATENGLTYKRTRKSWSLDQMKEYVSDYKSFGADYCINKYNEKDKKAVSNKVYMFRKKIKENE